MTEQKKNMDMRTSVTVALLFPVQLADRRLTEVTVRRPVMRDLLRHPLGQESGAAEDMAFMGELTGLPLEEQEYAAEIAMEHQLGLTCDPICGLVQIPCIERNAVAAKRAIDASNLSHMLVGTRTISFDMVVRTMYETGINMNRAFRETSEGGLARLYSRRAGK